MGDRSNVRVIDDTDSTQSVYLYTHWGGVELLNTVRCALSRRWRWNDGAYLTRIIFDVMKEDATSDETGFGISNHICDYEYPIIVVNPAKKAVVLTNTRGKELCPPLTFEEFIDDSSGLYPQFEELYLSGRDQWDK